jgi:hypothetical protein
MHCLKGSNTHAARIQALGCWRGRAILLRMSLVEAAKLPGQNSAYAERHHGKIAARWRASFVA